MAYIAIKNTTSIDLPDILRIRSDPLVIPHQYKSRHDDTPELWAARFNGDNQFDPYTFHCTTVFSHHTVIGYISHLHWRSGDCRFCQCGWDLDPQYWGQGIMCDALTQLFNIFFNRDDIRHVFADCFRDNRRCLRVLNKLGFLPHPIPLFHRLLIAWQTKCIRWIKRFCLDAERWRKTTSIIR